MLLVGVCSYAHCQMDYNPKGMFFNTKTTKFHLRYAKTINSCDTLDLNGKRYYVNLQSGQTSNMGYGGKKWEDTWNHAYLTYPEKGKTIYDGIHDDYFEIHYNQKVTKVLWVRRIVDGKITKVYR